MESVCGIGDRGSRLTDLRISGDSAEDGACFSGGAGCFKADVQKFMTYTVECNRVVDVSDQQFFHFSLVPDQRELEVGVLSLQPRSGLHVNPACQSVRYLLHSACSRSNIIKDNILYEWSSDTPRHYQTPK